MDSDAERLTRLLNGDKDQRGAALSELSALCASAGTVGRTASQESAVALAALCVPPLVAVLCEDESRVDGREAREATLVLSSLMQLDPLLVAKEYVQDGRCITLYTTQGSALDVLFGKAAEDLTRDDLLLAACSMLPVAVMMAQGSARVVLATELDADLEFWGRFFPVQPEFHTRAPTHERNRQLVMLALDLLRNPQGMRQMELAGIWGLMFWATSGRPVLFAEAVNAGLWDLALDTLRRIPAAEQVGWRTAEGILASGISITLRNICENPPGLDPTKQLIDTGTVELVVSALEAYEALGASTAVHEGNPCTLVHFLMMLQAFDITTAEAEPIYTRLQQIPSALRFLHDVNIDHVKGMGLSTASMSLVLVALLFGKEENDLITGFNADSVNDLVAFLQEQLSGTLVQFFPGLSAYWFKPCQFLCISDVNTALLIENKAGGLITLLLEALFLDPDSLRPDVTSSNKVAIQQCVAESLLQIALFQPGCDVLKGNADVVEALKSMEDKALSEEAKDSARKALAAIDGTELQSIAHARKREEKARAALQAHTVAKEQAEARAREEASLTGSERTHIVIERLRKEAEQAKASGDIEDSDAKLREIETIEQQVAAAEAEHDWDEDLVKRVEQRSQREPFQPGMLDDAARWTEDEMRANLKAMSEDTLGDNSATHQLVYHFTSLFSLDLIMGGHGLRASVYGQLNGGLSVSLADPMELDWEQWSGNRFREKVGRELWGEKWRSLLRRGKTAGGEEVDEGSDSDKIDYLIVLKVPKELVSDSLRILPGRNNAYIIHRKHLTAIDGWHYLGRGHIAKIYRLSNPEQEAELTQKLIMAEEEMLEDHHVMLSYEFGADATMQRVNKSLRRRGYNTWIATESMKGADIDEVSSAIEQADAMLIAVTNEYKESASCRLESTYARESQVDIIPLLVQPGYRGKGWLGMQISDKTSYELHSAGDDAAFEAQMDAVACELGDRGRPRIREDVPSVGVDEPATASAVAQAIARPDAEPSSQARVWARAPPRTQVPAPAPAAAHTPIPTSVEHSPERGSSLIDKGFSSSIQMVPMQSSIELSTMIERLLEQQREMMREQRQEAQAVWAKMESKLEAKDAELEAKDAKLAKMQAEMEPQQATSEEQLKALQRRVSKLQANDLLSDDVAFMIEDLIADYIELELLVSKLTRETMQANRVVKNVCTLVALSERVELDQAFARQLLRKFA